jgi:hypothetical protein
VSCFVGFNLSKFRLLEGKGKHSSLHILILCSNNSVLVLTVILKRFLYYTSRDFRAWFLKQNSILELAKPNLLVCVSKLNILMNCGPKMHLYCAHSLITCYLVFNLILYCLVTMLWRYSKGFISLWSNIFTDVLQW